MSAGGTKLGDRLTRNERPPGLLLSVEPPPGEVRDARRMLRAHSTFRLVSAWCATADARLRGEAWKGAERRYRDDCQRQWTCGSLTVGE